MVVKRGHKRMSNDLGKFNKPKTDKANEKAKDNAGDAPSGSSKSPSGFDAPKAETKAPIVMDVGADLSDEAEDKKPAEKKEAPKVVEETELEKTVRELNEIRAG